MLYILDQDVGHLESAKIRPMDIAADQLGAILAALAEQLHDLQAQTEIVVIGGSALLALGLVQRTTTDVDVVALAEGGTLNPADPLPPLLEQARARVARDFDLQPDWINSG